MSDLDVVQNVTLYQPPFRRSLGECSLFSSSVRFQYRQDLSSFAIMLSFVKNMQKHMGTDPEFSVTSQLRMDATEVAEALLGSMVAAGMQEKGVYTLMYEEKARSDGLRVEWFRLICRTDEGEICKDLEFDCLPGIGEAFEVENDLALGFTFMPTVSDRLLTRQFEYLSKYLPAVWLSETGRRVHSPYSEIGHALEDVTRAISEVRDPRARKERGTHRLEVICVLAGNCAIRLYEAPAPNEGVVRMLLDRTIPSTSN